MTMATYRTCEHAPGRLFPSMEWDHGWQLSLQADLSGYGCSPQERFPTLEEYDSVEGKLDGPFGMVVDPATLGLPPSVLAKFTPVGPNMPAIGRELTWDDVKALENAILRASLNPNAGVPRGVVGWAGRDVFHGCSRESALDILEHGVLMDRSSKGYFGQAYYLAEDEDLALSNYAAMEDEGEGSAVLRHEIVEGARILDLRNGEDYAEWQATGLADRVGVDGFAALARRKGVAGVYDRSVGGLAIFDPRALHGYVHPIWINTAAGTPSPRP
jgi:hypothetical protein